MILKRCYATTVGGDSHTRRLSIQLLVDGGKNRLRRHRSKQRDEVFLELLRINPELTETDHVVANSVFPDVAIGHAKGSLKAVHPSEKR